MATTANLLFALTAEDVMTRAVVTIPRRTSLREAARLLRWADVSGAPVVDDEGRCVGLLTAADFLGWVEDGCPDAASGLARACSYQEKGRLLTGEEAVVCTLAEGSCPLQVMQPTTGGRHVAVCLQPTGVLSDWQQVPENVPSEASRYMTTDVVSVGRRTPLPEVVRRMVDAHVHRVPVLDKVGRPVGIVSSTDVLAAVARDSRRLAGEETKFDFAP
jgi:CBS-domain-containing membrane protein